jgi:hypothetical protein
MNEVRSPEILEEVETLSSIPETPEKRLTMKLHIPDDLIYLDGHFDQFPVVPGVTQINWAATFLQHLMPGKKFFKPLRPNDTCWMELGYSSEKGRANFSLYTEDWKLTSGQFVIR